MSKWIYMSCALTLGVAAAAPAQELAPAEKLREHTDEFRQEVIEVTQGVHVAVGFGLANSILIEGDDAVIIVDTLESPATANAAKAEFDKISTKPVAAVVYTHFHADHIGGAAVFAGESKPDVYSYATTMSHIERSYGVLRPAITTRSIRQFGLGLPPEQFVNAGIGPRLVPNPNITGGFLPPTQTFDGERHETEIAGVKIVLVHAPGETEDQIFVWLPEKQVLLCGDNYYKSFPNLYAIRGTPYRDVRQWAESLDKMLALEPEYLVPSHTRPLAGKDLIRETLSNYRDAIRYVHDETVKGINAGLTPDELAAGVRLPDTLANQPYLQEFYGTVSWSVRAIFNGYLGWFDGNATSLDPLGAKERATRLAQMAGGEEKLLEHAKAALEQSDYRWTAELADYLLALDYKTDEARELKAQALTNLAETQISANGRNYYLVSAQQLRAQSGP